MTPYRDTPIVVVMDTTTAAAQAHVTVATIRTWCRHNVVAATKRAGRWIIDAASLAHRITLGKHITEARTARRAPHPVALTADTLTRIGGKRWTKAGKDRIYFNDWPEYAGLEYTTYNTGNISSAFYQGERISNSKARRFLGTFRNVYFDLTTGEFDTAQYSGRRDAEDDQILADIVNGIRTAIAAL